MTSDQMTTILSTTTETATTPAMQAKADKTKELLKGLGLGLNPTGRVGKPARELALSKNGTKAAATEPAPSVSEPMQPLVDGVVQPPAGTEPAKAKPAKDAKKPAAKPAKPKAAVAKPAKPKKEAKMTEAKTTEPKAPRETKAGKLVEMLTRPEGATVAEVAAAFEWLPHTTRAAISTLPKKPGFPAGKELTSTKDAERGRIYRIVDAATPAA